MKTKLTLLQISSYFPFKVKAKFKDLNNNRAIEIGTVCIITEAGDITCYDTVNAYPTKFKLLLRPMSALDEKALSDINCDILDQIKMMEFRDKQISLHNMPYGVVQILLQYHYDIFNLIDQGLAEAIKD